MSESGGVVPGASGREHETDPMTTETAEMFLRRAEEAEAEVVRLRAESESLGRSRARLSSAVTQWSRDALRNEARAEAAEARCAQVAAERDRLVNCVAVWLKTAPAVTADAFLAEFGSAPTRTKLDELHEDQIAYGCVIEALHPYWFQQESMTAAEAVTKLLGELSAAEARCAQVAAERTAEIVAWVREQPHGDGWARWVEAEFGSAASSPEPCSD